MKTWKTLERRTVLDRGKFLKVEEHTVQLPDGTVIPNWTWVVTPDFANVVAVDKDGRFILFRQTKYSAQGETLAVIGGYVEPGEDTLAAAKRELLEETGYVASKWTALGMYAVDGNRGAGHAHFYLAQDAERVAVRDADDLEEQELLLLSRDEVLKALLDGEFKVLPWVAAMGLALHLV